MKRFAWALFVLVILAPLAAQAQPLTDRVPADALVYVGWRGTETLGPAYDNSHLAAVLNASKLGDVWSAAMTQLVARLPQDNPEVTANIQAAIPLLQHAWKRPTALFLSPGIDKRGEFEPKFGVICDAGNAAADVHKALSAIVAQSGKGKPFVRTAIDGQIVVLTIGYDDAAVATKPTTPLRGSAAFTSAMQQVDPDPVYAIYADAERIVALIDQGAAKGKDKKMAASWPKISQALGLGGLKRFAISGAFEGKGWSSRMLIEAPEPRAGMVALLDTPPITDKSLAAIPQTAAFAMIAPFDLGKVFSQFRTAVAAGDPGPAADFDKRIANASQQIGVDIPQLIASFGGEWTVYADSGVGGVTQQGLVITNNLTDASKVEASLAKLQAKVKQLAAHQGNQQPINVTDTELGDHLTVHGVHLVQGGVNWVVKNNKLYIGFKPETVGAATLVGTQASPPNLAGNAKFADVRKRLGIDQMTGFRFADLAQTAPVRDNEMRQMLPLLGMLATNVGLTIPPDLLPKLEVVNANIFPSGAVTWTDKTGWHSRAISPFPGSSLYSSSQTDLISVGAVALGVSVALPSLNRARETANRVKCASNERQIGQAILLYSNDNRGKYPDDLGALLKTQDITIAEFTRPSGSIEPPADVTGGGIDKIAAWANMSSPYTYVGKGMNNTVGANVLILYEREDDHDGDGMNLLFGDGSVGWYDMETAKKIIADKKRTPNQ